MEEPQEEAAGKAGSLGMDHFRWLKL
jgi:hypothetical protein